MISQIRSAIAVLTLVSVGATAATGQVPAGAAPKAIAGCYQLTLGAWSRPLGVNAKYHELPMRIQLDTTPGPEQRGWRLSPDIAFPYPHRFPAPLWITKGDTIEMLWSNGFQPTWIRTTRQASGDLVGEAEVRSDANEFGSNTPHARVTARTIACDTNQ